ncbi:MAG: hypothetical protein ACYTE8_06245 [Planctomycetota bacterium]|jgi:anti-sigma factor RsiW
MEAEILEILIGKYIDGEITPREQEILDEEMERDFETRELIKQLKELDDRSREAVTAGILEHGKDTGDIFERAWRQRKNPLFNFLTSSAGWLRFASGLAAGLLIGIGLHFVLSSQPVPPNGVQGQLSAIQAPQVTGSVQRARTAELSNGSTKTVNRNVDWFSFTDKSGDQWIVEGLRKDVVRPASYSKQL